MAEATPGSQAGAGEPCRARREAAIRAYAGFSPDDAAPLDLDVLDRA
ncbi:hypothetical protein ABZ883_33355 [Streptomyces sp. NPDC046977]